MSVEKTPLVSICIPAFNAEKYLKKCIERCLMQTYSNFEIIVCDDASTDKTAEIVKGFNDERIKYLRNEKNLGWLGNVKRLYEVTTGDFVTMLPVDDYLEFNFIERALNIFNQYENVAIWGCSHTTVNEVGEIVGQNIRKRIGYVSSGDLFRHVFKMVDVSPPAETMIRKIIFDKVNGAQCYCDIYKQFPEISLYLKIADAGYDGYFLEEKLTFRTARMDSLTGKFGDKAFVLLDNYNIINQYKGNRHLDNKSVFLTNNYIARRLLRKIKCNFFNFSFGEVIRLLKVFIKNDYEYNIPGFKNKIKRFTHLISFVLDWDSISESYNN